MGDLSQGGFMKANLFSLVAIAMLLTQSQSQAIPVITTTPIIGEIGYGGSGCPVGTARLEIGQDTDETSFQFVFDNYSVSTDGRQIARAACSLTIPIQVPKGYALVLPDVRLNGYSDLQVDEEGKLNTEVFWAGGQGNLNTELINGNNDGAFSVPVTNTFLDQTPCGASVNLRVNTSVLINGHFNSGSFIQINRLNMKLPLDIVACNH
jgi:hypothetical protein